LDVLEDYERNKNNLKPYIFTSYNAISVIKLDKENNFIEEFNTITKAAESIGISGDNISKVCNGKRKTAG
jgi:ribosomal protein S2